MRAGYIAVAAALLAAPLKAQEASKSEAKAEAPVAAPIIAVTRHSGRFAGRTINYVATAGETYLADKTGKPSAAIFSITYV